MPQHLFDAGIPIRVHTIAITWNVTQLQIMLKNPNVCRVMSVTYKCNMNMTSARSFLEPNDKVPSVAWRHITDRNNNTRSHDRTKNDLYTTKHLTQRRGLTMLLLHRLPTALENRSSTTSVISEGVGLRFQLWTEALAFSLRPAVHRMPFSRWVTFRAGLFALGTCVRVTPPFPISQSCRQSRCLSLPHHCR